ncbi:MAG TPA: amidohydrolase [Candidatus Sulfotelmatobacter sp.]|nr:amidohydrolase [Candidatus Sulfotelmatobacter sp.]
MSGKTPRSNAGISLMPAHYVGVCSLGRYVDIIPAMIYRIVFCLLLLCEFVTAQTSFFKEANNVYPEAHEFYVDLHEHPELSTHETQTAAKLATGLRSAGYEVTERVGGTGVVAILKNGAGPTIMLRTELDALPVEEKTGLAYASKVRTKDDAGRDVPVMHACGHDLHMASLLGTAEIMARSKGNWHGTLILIGQPAEEAIGGAKSMLGDGLFTRFPKPDAIVALHVANVFPAGVVGITPGVYNTNSDSVRITIYGKGGHGAMPQTTIDPIVIAARTILALQTIASREVKPGEMAVVTVGYIRAGNKNNIIPDQAEMGLTIRTRNPEVRKQVLAAITRMAKAEAAGAGAPREPLVERYEGTDLVYNNPELAEKLRAPLEAALGKANVVTAEPIAPSEDFSYFVEQGVPGFYFSLGGADPQKFAEAKAEGTSLPSNHSPLFAPDVDPALHTGIVAEVAVLRNLLNTPVEELHKFAATPQP